MLQLGKMHEALVLLNKNATNNALPNYASEKLRTFKLLYETNFGLKKYEDAFRWNDSLRILDNLLRDADVRKEMANLETKYQTEKKEQQITLLIAENEIKNQRIVLAMLFIGFLLLLGLLALALFYFRRKQAHFKQSELQQQLLRSQMNPHFIFNVMGSIQGYLYKNEATKAAEYLSRFAALSRSVLEISSQESITLKEEIEMLQNYIELQKTVMEKPFNVEYFIDEEMETDYIQIPPMLLQPFVENAIKHGLKNLNYQGKLSLCFKEKQDYIAVEIVDNGSGLEQNADSAHKSKALEIFQQRKKGIEHKFKKELIFEFQNLNTIDKTKHGVRVYLQLPILNND
jgi:LytS/YehU family sensor histidine kinase